MPGQGIPLRSKLLVLTAVMASLLEIIDTSIVNVSIPTMMGNLGATLDEISWVITGYIIANAIVLPIAGWMSEQIGRKTYYTGCIIMFTAASVACGLAPNLTTLVIFRVLQGFAGGALLPTSQALIYESFPKEQAGMASAIYGMSVMIGPTLGPTLGGYLTDNFGWRSIFNINLPLGVIVAMLSYSLVEDVGVDPTQKAAERAAAKESGVKIKRERKPIDAVGLFLLIAGVGCAQAVLERGNAEDWFSSGWIIAGSFVGVVCLVGLIWWELRTEHPILELKHFSNNNFRNGVLLMAGLGAMLYGLMFLLPVFVTSILGLTATQTGELFIPGALAAAAMMPMIGIMLKKSDARILIFAGTVLLAIAILSVSHFDSQTSVDGIFWPLLIRGIAMSFLFVPINTVVLTQFSGSAISQAAGMLNLCRQLGGSIAIAGLSTLFQRFQVQAYSVLSSHVTWFDPPAARAYNMFLGGMRGKMQNLVGMGSHSMDSLKILYFRVAKEAFVISFQKTLLIGVVMFSLTLYPLMRMRRPKPQVPGQVIDAH